VQRNENKLSIGQGPKQTNSLDAFQSCRQVNDQNSVSLMDNPDTEDIQGNSNSPPQVMHVHVGLPVVDRFQQL